MRKKGSLGMLAAVGALAYASEALPDAEAALPQPVGAQAASDGRVDTLVRALDAGTGGLSVRNDGTIYSADFGAILGDASTAGTRVWAITASGEASVFAEGLSGASGNAIDSQGNFYQSNIRGGTISRISRDGVVEEFVSDGIQGPVGIEVDDADTLYVANCGSNSIQRVTQAGESTRMAESDLLSCPNGITGDESGVFYIANFNNGDVLRMTGSGEVDRLATLPGGNNGHLIYHDGALYVVARGAHSVYRVTLDGNVELFAGTGARGYDDGAALASTFSFPNDIGVSPDGNVFYINEQGRLDASEEELSPTRIRRIVRTGTR